MRKHKPDPIPKSDQLHFNWWVLGVLGLKMKIPCLTAGRLPPTPWVTGRRRMRAGPVEWIFNGAGRYNQAMKSWDPSA
ncbi:MAG: hypothetical protein IIB44_10540 [Candidatus Marinimicrobia bacterium]|nr:hypothetical protein [Candidatus Neomarinimicrobiota bacterium]